MSGFILQETIGRTNIFKLFIFQLFCLAENRQQAVLKS